MSILAVPGKSEAANSGEVGIPNPQTEGSDVCI